MSYYKVKKITPNLETIIELDKIAQKDTKEFPRIEQVYEGYFDRGYFATFLNQYFNNFGLKFEKGSDSSVEDISLRDDNSIDVHYRPIEIIPFSVYPSPSTLKIKFEFFTSKRLSATALLDKTRLGVIKDLLEIHYAAIKNPIVLKEESSYLLIAPVNKIKRFLEDAKLAYRATGKNFLDLYHLRGFIQNLGNPELEDRLGFEHLPKEKVDEIVDVLTKHYLTTLIESLGVKGLEI